MRRARSVRDVLRERSALSVLRVAARRYARAVAHAQECVAAVRADDAVTVSSSQLSSTAESRALDAIHSTEEASAALEAAALRFAERSPAPRRRKGGRK